MTALKALLKWSPTEAGRIKIGMNKKANNKMGKLPVKISGMLITKSRKDENNLNFLIDLKAHKKLNAVSPEGAANPIYSIPIEFDSDNIENFLFVRKASYKGKTCVCSFNGEQAITNEGEIVSCETCPKNNPNYSSFDKCKVNASLYVKIVGVTPLGKYHIFKTTGWNSFQALGNSILSLWKEGAGRLRGPIFNLTFGEKTTVDVTGATRKVPVVSVEFEGTREDLHSKIIENAKKEAEYMTNVRAIDSLKINNSQNLFIDDLDVEEFYPEAQELPEPEQQQIGSNIEENEIVEEIEEVKETINPRDEIVKKLCQDLGWTEALLKGKRIPTLKSYLEGGVMPPKQESTEKVAPEKEIEETKPIKTEPIKTEPVEDESIEDEVPDFITENDEDDKNWGDI